MTNQVTVIKERARESLIAKGMLGESLCYYEAIQLCYNGYDVWMVPVDLKHFFLRVAKIDGNPVIFKHMEDGCVFEYYPHTADLFEDWIVKN